MNPEVPINHEHKGDVNPGPPQSTLEKFLRAVEQKTSSQIHHRLLKACRQTNPAEALETALRTIVTEIIDEA